MVKILLQIYVHAFRKSICGNEGNMNPKIKRQSLTFHQTALNKLSCVKISQPVQPESEGRSISISVDDINNAITDINNSN
jgi:hypothetical protein